MSEIRKNPVTGQWVIIAPERSLRPVQFERTRVALNADFCPFCKGNESATPAGIRAWRADGTPAHAPTEGASPEPWWDVRVVPNRYPALRVEEPLRERGQGIYDLISGIGAHEVVIEASDHVEDMADLGVAHIATILRAWKERILDLRQDGRLKSVQVFKNHGADAGATLAHAHSQIVALPLVPWQLEQELEGAARYHDFRGRCVFCDILDQEREQGERVVLENEHVSVIAPYASRFPFELWLLPRRHEPWYEAEADERLVAVADALRATLRKLNAALEHPSYNLFVHTAPAGHRHASHFHWHLELIPHVTKPGGFEWGTGYHINPTAPEVAARHLREIDIR